METRAIVEKWLPAQGKRARRLLKLWSEQNSGTTNYQGLSKMAELLCQEFASLGKLRKVELLPVERIDTAGKKSVLNFGPLLMMHKRPKAPIQLLLGGHYDTVFSKDSPFQRCTDKGSTIIGPGVADMKGGLLTLLIGLEAFEQTTHKQNIGWRLLMTPDEEIGSPATKKFWQKYANAKNAVFLFEPAFDRECLISSRKGSFSYSIAIQGVSAHAGRDFHSGVNALSALVDLLHSIQHGLENEEGLTFNIGRVVGGESANIVAERALALINVRAHLPKVQQIAKKRIAKSVSDVSMKYPRAKVELTLLSERPVKEWRKDDENLFNLLADAGREIGLTLKKAPSGGVTDGNFTAEVGPPTIDSMGPYGGGLHTHEEWVDLDSIIEKAKLFFLLLVTLSKKAGYD